MERNNRKKAVALAQDVLKNLHLIKVINKNYCLRKTDPEGIKENDSIRPKIDKLANGCCVCALGSLFLSYARLYNQVKLSNLRENPKSNWRLKNYFLTGNKDCTIDLDYDFLNSKLSNIFTQKQIDLIEQAFEIGEVFSGSGNTHGDQEKTAVEFGKRYKNPRDRLIAIMKNIIKNDGVFTPPSLSSEFE